MEQERLHRRFFDLVSRFALQKEGSEPWNADVLDAECAAASHGEQCVIRFLLYVWNPAEPWKCGPFDFFDAISVWDDRNRQAFLSWASDPFWP